MAAQEKILILYASAGHGHQKAAEAVAETCAEHVPGLKTECLDVLDFMPPFFGKNYKGFYIFLIKRLPWVWGALYGLADMPVFYWLIAPVRDVMNRLVARRLTRRLCEEDPSAIVSAHFLSTQMAGRLKKKKKISSRLVTVVTDYLPHFFWLDSEVDVYAVGADETRKDLIRRGVDERRIHVTGIPTEKKFRVPTNRTAAAHALGIDPGRFTVLLTSGGAGVGDIAIIAERLVRLPQAPQVLVICGTNKELFSVLDEKSRVDKNLKVFSFVSNMHEFMAASDLLVGKGGGLTIAESLCLGKPLLLYKPVPGQETRNSSVMCRYGAAMEAPSIDSIVDRAAKLISDRPALERMSQSARSLGKPGAALHVVDLAASP